MDVGDVEETLRTNARVEETSRERRCDVEGGGGGGGGTKEDGRGTGVGEKLLIVR